MQLYHKGNLEELMIPDNENGRYAEQYLIPMIKNGVECYIENINVELMLLAIDEHLLPIVIAEKNYTDSYVVSTYTHFVSYAKAELRELNYPLLEKVLAGVLSILGFFLKRTNINQAVYVNNWFLSTNLYPELSSHQLLQLTCFLKRKFPRKAIVFRSINHYAYPKISQYLQTSGYQFVGTRQVWFAKKRINMSRNQRKQLNQDLKKREQEQYDIVEITDTQDGIRLLELYNELYIEHYSVYNPRFSKTFLSLAIEKKLFTIKALRKGQQIDGFFGYFSRCGVMTTPLLGYDFSLPKRAGLYRMLTAQLNIESENNKLLLHRSSGAAHFKSRRGANSAIEYSAVYEKHLPLRQRIGWLTLKWIVEKFAIPLLKKKVL